MGYMSNIDVLIRGRLSTEEDQAGLTQAIYDCVLNTGTPDDVRRVMEVMKANNAPSRVLSAYLDATIEANKAALADPKAWQR